MEQGLNLIQQLQQTPKWEKFKDWYKSIPELQYSYSIDSIELACGNFYAFRNFPFMFQKGVFEKFIEESNDYLITIITSKLGVHCIIIENNSFKKLFYSFEEFLIWYFNN